jgi:hypothetical protein
MIMMMIINQMSRRPPWPTPRAIWMPRVRRCFIRAVTVPTKYGTMQMRNMKYGVRVAQMTSAKFAQGYEYLVSRDCSS